MPDLLLGAPLGSLSLQLLMRLQALLGGKAAAKVQLLGHVPVHLGIMLHDICAWPDHFCLQEGRVVCSAVCGARMVPWLACIVICAPFRLEGPSGRAIEAGRKLQM